MRSQSVPSRPRGGLGALAAAAALAAGLAAAPIAAMAESVALGSVEFSPATFVPGDLVRLYARLDPGAASWSEESRASGFSDPGGDGPRIVSASVVKRGGTPLLEVGFVAWRAGQGYLPELSLGGLTIPRIRFECASTLADGRLDPPGPLPQLDHPGLRARLYAMGGLFLVAVVAAATIAARASPWFGDLRERRAMHRSRKEFDELLDRLSGSASDPAAWAELCAGAKRLVGLRSGADWGPMTASEVGALPAEAAPGGVAPELASLIYAGDSVRFAGLSGVELGPALLRARAIADRLDEAWLKERAERAGPRRPAPPKASPSGAVP